MHLGGRYGIFLPASAVYPGQAAAVSGPNCALTRFGCGPLYLMNSELCCTVLLVRLLRIFFDSGRLLVFGLLMGPLIEGLQISLLICRRWLIELSRNSLWVDHQDLDQAMT